jgi:cytochrome c oxidase assembly protein subunit 15
MDVSATSVSHNRAIRLWLYAVAALVFVMVLVGGATRLTESGLSITEWKPVMGTLPPLGAKAWQSEFDKYKAIPQYREMNQGMSLEAFKTIYWWEWTHRLLGRLIGVAFLVPFLWFLWRGWVEPGLRGRLLFIFGLGALQGAVGWWMVASGLVHRVEVSQYRLATHLVLACVIFVAMVWTAQRMASPVPGEIPRRIRNSATALLLLVLLQIYLGALVAGLRAGLIYNTWPLIDGGFIPKAADLFFHTPVWRNFFENALTVQFNHRMVAYAIWIFAALHLADAVRTRRAPAVRGAAAVFAAVTVQATLGIVTLLHQAPLALALTHQAMAMVTLSAVAVHAARLALPRAEQTPHATPVSAPVPR